MECREVTIRQDGPAPAVAPLAIMPVLRAKDFLARRQAVYELLREVMIDGTDYGQIPGTPKPTLFKAGAEKLAQLFGFTLDLVPVQIVENWGDAGSEPFLYYKYECRVTLGDRLVVAYTGLAHSREEKYRWRWVPEPEVPRGLDRGALERRAGTAREPKFAVDKAQTDGQYGKPAEHWALFRTAISRGTARAVKMRKKDGTEMDAWEIDTTVYRVPNPAVEDLAHTLTAMAQKRAMVGAVRIATNATDIFDVRDEVDEGHITIDGEWSVVNRPEESSGSATTNGDLRPAERDGRPWLNLVLKNKLQTHAANLTTPAGTWTSEARQKLAIKLKEICGNDDKRHAFLQVVFGKRSLNDLTDAECEATSNWLKTDQAGRHKSSYTWNAAPDIAAEEVAALLAAVQPELAGASGK